MLPPAIARQPLLAVRAWLLLSGGGRATLATVATNNTALCNATLLREGYHPYVLLSSRAISEDTKLLRFALPESMPTLGLPLPSCLKVRLQKDQHTMTKSYSPISLPAQPGYVELLAKGYPPRPPGHPPIHGHPGGVAAHLNRLDVWMTAELELKKPRIIWNAPYTTNRWAELGLAEGQQAAASSPRLASSGKAAVDEHASFQLSTLPSFRLSPDQTRRLGE